MSQVRRSERSQNVIDSDGTEGKICVASAPTATGFRRRASSWDDSDDEFPSPSTQAQLQKGRIYSADSKANRESAVTILNGIKEQYFGDLRKQTENPRNNETDPVDRRQSPARVRRRTKSSMTSSPSLESSLAIESFNADEADAWAECSAGQGAVRPIKREHDLTAEMLVGNYLSKLHVEHKECVDGEVGFEEKLPAAANECLMSPVEVEENNCRENGGFYCRTSRKLSKILEIDERRDFESDVMKDFEIPEIDKSKMSIDASSHAESHVPAEEKTENENEGEKMSNGRYRDEDDESRAACSEDGSGSSPLPTARTVGSCGTKNTFSSRVNLSEQNFLMKLSSRSTGNNLKGSISERCSKISSFDDDNLVQSPKSATSQMDLFGEPEPTRSKTLERFLRDYPMASTWIGNFYKKGGAQSLQESLKIDLNIETPVEVRGPVSSRYNVEKGKSNLELDSVPPSPKHTTEIEVEESSRLAESVVKYTRENSGKSWEPHSMELPPEEANNSFKWSERNVEHEKICSPREWTERMSERLKEPLVNYSLGSPKVRGSNLDSVREKTDEPEPMCFNFQGLFLEEQQLPHCSLQKTPSSGTEKVPQKYHVEVLATEPIRSSTRKTAVSADMDDNNLITQKQLDAETEENLLILQQIDGKEISIKTSFTNLKSPKSKSTCSLRAKFVGEIDDLKNNQRGELYGNNGKERSFTTSNSTSSFASSRRSYTEKLSPISLTDIVERGSSSCFSSSRSKESDTRADRHHDTLLVSKYTDTIYKSESHRQDGGNFPKRCQKVDCGSSGRKEKSFGDGPSTSRKNLNRAEGGNVEKNFLNERFNASFYETNNKIKIENSEKVAECLEEKFNVHKKTLEKGNRCRTERDHGDKYSPCTGELRKRSLEEELWKKLIDTFHENCETTPGLLAFLQPEKFSQFFRGRHFEKQFHNNSTALEMRERSENQVYKKEGISRSARTSVQVAETSETENSATDKSLQLKKESTGVDAGSFMYDKDGVRMGEFGDTTSYNVDTDKFPETGKPKDHGDGNGEEIICHCKAFSAFTGPLKKNKEGSSLEEFLDCPAATKNCKDKSDALVSSEWRRSKSQTLITRWEASDSKIVDEWDETEKRHPPHQKGSPSTAETVVSCKKSNENVKWSDHERNLKTQISNLSPAPSTHDGLTKICYDFNRFNEISLDEKDFISEGALKNKFAGVRDCETARKLRTKTWLTVNKREKMKKIRAKNKLEKRKPELDVCLQDYESTLVSNRTSYVTLLKLRKSNCFQSFYRRLIQVFCVTSASSAATSK